VTIDPARGVVVSVPPATRRGWVRPEPRIESFLRERETWLRHHLDLHARQRAVHAARGGLRDGASFRYRGELVRLRVIHSAVARRTTVWLSGTGEELIIERAARDPRGVADALETWLRLEARRAIDAEIESHATALGVSPAGVSVRDQRSRWGSASRHGRLSFSWRLVLAPPEALETVVVHELAHLRVFGHGPQFWDLVASRRPDHLVWRRWLRTHSLEMHAALDGVPLAEAGALEAASA
jgi:predicted metal-dependent hydrolase